MGESLREVLSRREIDRLVTATLCNGEACVEELGQVLEWARHTRLAHQMLERVLAGQMTVSVDRGRPRFHPVQLGPGVGHFREA